MDPRGRIRGFKKLASVEFRKMQQLVRGRRSDESALELQQGSSEPRERPFQEEQLRAQQEVRGHEEGVELLSSANTKATESREQLSTA